MKSSENEEMIPYRKPSPEELASPNFPTLNSVAGWYINPINYTQIAWYDGVFWSGQVVSVSLNVSQESKRKLELLFDNKISHELKKYYNSESPLDDNNKYQNQALREIDTICEYCDSKNDKKSEECVVCGAVYKKYKECDNCGKKLDPKMIICINCGLTA